MCASQKVELLSPAKDFEVARQAILAGADAVYMGSPKFGARKSASNSISDLENVAKFAHTYGAKLYIALNTILDDYELQEAEKLAHNLYEIGADALIVQDLGLLSCNLPPIEIHASTQCDIRTPEKAKFLESCGFSTLVLARELTLSEIKKISENVECNIETFVHGALCVSYSGQCYLSAAIGNRSGNRGECAQPCRMKYALLDSEGKSLAPDSHFLSLKDFNASLALSDMLDAGVRSFKIEGRLKDGAYVKNITAYYRKLLDEQIAKKNLTRASLGKTSTSFEADPAKSFNRGFTEYFLRNDSQKNIASFDTPKSKGEYLGLAKNSISGGFEIENCDISNGDGLLIKNPNGEIFGSLVQKVLGQKIICSKNCPKIFKGAQIWRNKNLKFEKQISAKDASRKIDIIIDIFEEDKNLIFEFIEPQTRIKSRFSLDISLCELAQDSNVAISAISKNIAKLGSAPFETTCVNIKIESVPFLKISQVNEIRRTLCDELEKNLQKHFFNARILKENRKTFTPPQSAIDSISQDYRANVMNKKAKSFYESKGVKILETAFESGHSDTSNCELMRTRHCILRELNMCKGKGDFPKKFVEPLYLKSDEACLKLKFYCGKCGMGVYKADANFPESHL